jgi:DNA-binding GntR family transcriptional regulator
MIHEKYLDLRQERWYAKTNDRSENEMKREQAKITPLIKTNLNNQIYQIIKEMIADQRFTLGGYINVEQLTHELGVSRTPLWEAIRRLEQEGIVIHSPHKGVRVRELTREMALELYIVREALETTAARLGAGRATSPILSRMESCLKKQSQIVKQGDTVAYSRSDYEFHLLIYEASGITLIKEILEGLRYKALPLAFHIRPQLSEFLGYHREILSAFCHKDGQKGEEAIRKHNRRMIELIQTSPWESEAEA